MGLEPADHPLPRRFPRRRPRGCRQRLADLGADQPRDADQCVRQGRHFRPNSSDSSPKAMRARLLGLARAHERAGAPAAGSGRSASRDILERVPALAHEFGLGAAERDLSRELPFEAFAKIREAGIGTLRVPDAFRRAGRPASPTSSRRSATLASGELNVRPRCCALTSTTPRRCSSIPTARSCARACAAPARRRARSAGRTRS